MNSIRCRRVSHLNVVIENFDRSIEHLQTVLGGWFMMDLPGPHWHACLIEVGGHILELFEPPGFLLNSRHGPHVLGVEYEAEMTEVRAAVAARNIGIMRDVVAAIHTDPADGYGVDYEFFDGTFYGPDAPHVHQHSQSAEYWRAHAMGYTGFVGYTHAVRDIAAASAFLKDFVTAEIAYEEDRPALGARAIGMRIADDVCELVSPTGDGALYREMMRTGEGIRSAVWGVADLARARDHLAGHGMRLIEGTAPGSIAIDPRDNQGILFEFVERG